MEAKYVGKIVTIGNSLGVTIPSDKLTELKADKGDFLKVTISKVDV